MRLLIAAALLFCAASAALADQHPGLGPITAIQDAERRSKEALEFAKRCLDAAVKAYRQDDLDAGKRELAAIGDAVEVAVQALESTGKHPRRHPRHFKNAEIRTRRLLQQLHEARRKAHLEDFPDFDEPIRRVEQVNRQLLLGIMSPRN